MMHVRVLYIAQNYHPMNASSITTSGIIGKLAEKGHETILLAPQRCPKECVPICSLNCKGKSRITVTKTPTLIPYYLINKYTNLRALILAFSHFFLVLQGIRICKRKKVDVIIAQHHPSDFASFSAFILSSIFKLPLIIKTHDVYNSASDVLESIFLSMLGNIHRVIFRFANCVLVVSDPLRLKMIRTHKVGKGKIFVFPNAVDSQIFRPDVESTALRRSLGIRGKKIVLFIGRIRRERGLTLLIKTLPEITRKNSSVMVLVIGEGPEKLSLERLAEMLNVERFIKFLQPVDHSEMPKYICISDVTIGPLIATVDTFGSVPRKVLEYMACAKPVIALQGGVSEDLITDGYTGFLIHSTTTAELASIILRVINDSLAAKEIGLNARECVKKFYDWDRIIDKFEKIMLTTSTKS